MIKIENTDFSKADFSNVHLFICMIGYEERSSFILDKLKDFLNTDNTIILVADNYFQYKNAKDKIDVLTLQGYKKFEVNYFDFESVTSIISTTVQDIIRDNSNLIIHIDYSSMPRNWYCRLPKLLDKILRPEDIVYFWYSEGIYKNEFDNYPTSGIDAFQVFSGKPSIFSQTRVHILGLGYDSIRTQGIISIVDPERMILFEAYDFRRKDILENIIRANEQLLSQASMITQLEISDFKFMIAKICEIINEYNNSDVILIPDGPKPLILAMSLAPDLVARSGVTCLHVTRNNNQFVPVEVEPSGEIVGFSMALRP